MYTWYRQADVCYAYLADVDTATSVMTCNNTLDYLQFDRNGLFARSRWFTRGWTLQELIAPRFVEFYAADWTEIGTKGSLAEQLADITATNSGVLNGVDPSRCNVAEKFSWAASRETTKVEDAGPTRCWVCSMSICP